MKSTLSIPLQLIILLLSVFLCIVLASFLGQGAISLLIDNPENIDLNDPKTYLIFGFFTQFIGFIGGFLLFLKLTQQSFKALVKLSKPELKLTLLIIGVFALALPLISILSYLNSFIIELIPNNSFVLQELEIKENQFNLLSARSLPMMAAKLFVIALLPAIGEELVFRGVLLTKIREASHNEHYGVIVSGVLFAVIHMQPSNLIPMIVLGIILGYIYTRTNNIFYAMLFHFMFNSMTVLSAYFFSEMLTQ